ncbi:MAG: AAA-like domain-containing protein [Clostridiales bacterium]|nr:AAA-like domain-containing protein [Clostridiales bacterium]
MAMKRFNVTGLCVPEEDYMVDIGGKIEKIVELVNARHYFTINRARQYGKTTTLNELKKGLAKEYICASISFEGADDEDFETTSAFCSMFLQKVSRALAFSTAPKGYVETWRNEEVLTFGSLSEHITNMCSNNKVVLLIDEVDKTSSNRVFLLFLGMLREKFLARKAGKENTFHSVILAGVYDIRNLKLKMINDGLYSPSQTEGQLYNSPWNIAVNFNVDMSFSPAEIATMLSDYESDHHTGMDIPAIADEIHLHTSGYPFLVSRICQAVDEELDKDWTIRGVQEAIKIVTLEKNMLFDDLAKNLEGNTDLYDFLYSLLIIGEPKSFVPGNPVIELGSMYGYIKKGDGAFAGKTPGFTVVANKIFEMRMSYHFSSKDENVSRIQGYAGHGLYQEVVREGVFDMELCLRKFTEHYREIFNEGDLSFFERHGRLLFISYLKPLVNGHGFYHIESQFTDLRRMDVVVDYGRDQFIIELKIWRGSAAQEDAYEQLLGYMASKNMDRGYLLTFDFRKDARKEQKAEWVQVGGKRIFEVVV